MSYYLFTIPSCKHISSTHCRTVDSTFIVHLRPVNTTDKAPFSSPLGFIEKIPFRKETTLSIYILDKAFSNNFLTRPFIGYLMVRSDLQLNHVIGGLIHSTLILFFIKGLFLREEIKGFCFNVPTEEFIGIFDVLAKLPAFFCKELGLFIVTTGDNTQRVEKHL